MIGESTTMCRGLIEGDRLRARLVELGCTCTDTFRMGWRSNADGIIADSVWSRHADDCPLLEATPP